MQRREEHPNQKARNEKETDTTDRQTESEEQAPQSNNSLGKVSNPSPHSGSLAAEKNRWNFDDHKGALPGEHKESSRH